MLWSRHPTCDKPRYQRGMLLLMIRDSRRNTRTPNYKRVIIFSFVGGGGGGMSTPGPTKLWVLLFSGAIQETP